MMRTLNPAGPGPGWGTFLGTKLKGAAKDSVITINDAVFRKKKPSIKIHAEQNIKM